MGCIGSHFSHLLASSSSLDRESSSSRRRSVFPVLNVDELGRHLSPGKLEVTDTDLLLHIQGKVSLSWPLRSLRRYGYDLDLFSFEAGRRCPTGAGIYAFKCNQAQTLFELLQARIQGNPTSLPLLPPTNPAQTATANLSPLSLSPTFDYVNISENQARNNNFVAEAENGDPLYMNVDNPPAPLPPSTLGLSNGNVRRHRKLTDNGSSSSVPLLLHQDLRPTPAPSVLYTNLRCPPPSRPELNYAELDLNQARNRQELLPQPPLRLQPSPDTHTLTLTQTSLSSASRTMTSFEEPTEVAGALGYATIDFDRTAALSVVTRAKVKLDFQSSSTEREEESEEVSASLTTTTTAVRKTRHNSTAL